jgi:Bacterial protein of unknown function (DUF839)
VKRVSPLVAVLVVAGVTAAFALSAPGTETGPSSSQSPYIVRSQPGIVTKSILTVGDSVDGYRMVGIPDGLGAFDNGNGTFTLLMNHELGATAGVVRGHGAKGAFVSRWTIEKDSLRVLEGEDLIQQVATWNTALASHNPPAAGVTLGRLCSADLPAETAFYNPATGKGYGTGRIFMDGEEVGPEGRGFAHVASGADAGTSYELPHLGKFSWENSVAHPATGDATVVVGLDDSSNGQVYVYVGSKGTTGNPTQRAGLSGGTLYGLKVALPEVDGVPTETDSTAFASMPFTLANLGNVSGLTGAQLETASDAADVAQWQRPEDGSWDPSNPRDFYWVTTASFTGKSRLWRLRFEDPANPAAGGTITMQLYGTEGQRMLDNLTVNDRGQVLIQEDIGNQALLSKVWIYNPESDALTEVAQHDPDRFTPGSPDFITQDEESSGIIPASFLGESWYLLDVQVHLSSADAELVEGGQLLALHVPPGRYGK